jgi:hypothetical protein
MNSDLERRYRSLLRIFPAAYRADHEDEIVSTLAGVSREGQRWPSGREAWALLAAGIRLRALAAGGGGPNGLALDGLHLGAVLLVAGNAVGAVFAAYAGNADRWHVALGLAWVFAFATLVRGGWILPVAAAATAAALAVWLSYDALVAQPAQWFAWAQVAAGALLPAVLIAVLAHRRRLPGRSPLLLLVPAVPYALAMGIVVSPFFLTSTLFAMLVVVSGIALLALPLDPRPAIAVAVFLVPTISLLIAGAAQNVALWVEPSWTWPSVWALICVTLGTSGVRASRRVARI